MKVYIAELEWYYEGSEIIGVFTTEQRAWEEGDKRRVITHDDGTTYSRGDELVVNGYEVEE